MSNVLKTIVNRPTKVTRGGEKIRLLPGDPFPFNPQSRAHKSALMNGSVRLESAESESLDLDDILDKIRAVNGVGPALFAKIEEAVRGD